MVLAVVVQAGTEAPASANPHLPRAVAQLRALDEAAALKTLEQARAWTKNTPRDLAFVHMYIGLANAGLARDGEAQASFGKALLLDPDLELPRFASPRVRDWWTRAGGKVEAAPAPAKAEAGPPVPPPQLALKPAAAVPPPAPVVGPATPSPAKAPVAGAGISKSRAVPWVGVGLAAAGLAGLGVAAWNGTEASRLGRKAAGESDLRQAVPDQASAQRASETANVLFGVGGALAVAGGAVFAWTF